MCMITRTHMMIIIYSTDNVIVHYYLTPVHNVKVKADGFVSPGDTV